MKNKMKEIKNKVTVWCDEHQWEAGYWTGGAVALVGCCIGIGLYSWKHGKDIVVAHEGIKSVLNHAEATLPKGQRATFCWIADEAYKAKDLGKLGEVMIEQAARADIDPNVFDFSHVIMVGKQIE